MNHNCLKALIMCRIRKDDRDIEGGGGDERRKMLSGDWALITMGGKLLLFPVSSFYPTFHADIASAVTSGPISSQQCDGSTNYYWKRRTREANREIWKASGGVKGVRILNQECWQCQSMVIFSMDEQWAGHRNNALNFTNPHVAFLHRFKGIILSRPIRSFLKRFSHRWKANSDDKKIEWKATVHTGCSCWATKNKYNILRNLSISILIHCNGSRL